MSDARLEARDARFDDAIDRAVREMLDVEPRADLRARVMARIEEPSADTPVASGFRRKFWLIGAPIAAAAIIILAVMIARRDAAGPALAPTAPPSIAQATPPSAQPRVATPPPTTTTTTVDAGTGRNAQPRQVVAERGAPSPRAASVPVNRLAAGATVGAASTDATTVGVQPLKGVTPISVAVVHPPTIEETEIAIGPLRPIADVQVAPLSPPERRH